MTPAHGATDAAVSADPRCKGQAPVFEQPWHAQVFALTVALHEAGCFSWPEWAGYLSAAIAQAQAQGDPDRGDTYYRHWLQALERLVLDKSLADPLALTSLRQAWRVAAERAAHGEPIRLAPGVRFRSERA